MWRRRNLAACLFLICLGVPAPSAGAQGLEKTSRQGEVEAGRAAAREVEQQMPTSTNMAYQERVRRIGAALVDALPEKMYPYQFKVLAVPEFNAFCLPGGFMFVFEGLLSRLPDDDEVAFVMAHEITHAWHRHSVAAIKKNRKYAPLAILAGVATGSADAANIVHALLSRKYSRSEESDADETGMELMWRAGFNPDGALRATQLMADMEKGSSIPRFLRDHPPGEDRLNHLRKRIGELKIETRPPLGGVSDASAVEAPDTATLLGPLPTGVPMESPWLPLAVGNTWTYSVGEGDAAARYTIKVVGRIPLPTGAAYRLETAIGSTRPVPFRLLITDTGAWRGNGMDGGPWTLEYAFASSTPNQQGKQVALMTAEPVSTPCGTFTDVLRVRVDDGGKASLLTFARGVGLVRREWVDTGLSESLQSYSIAPLAPGSGTPPNIVPSNHSGHPTP